MARDKKIIWQKYSGINQMLFSKTPDMTSFK